jgi:Fe-S cluster assembly ATP-binding protein
MIEIKNLHVSVDGQPVLRGLNLTVNEGEVHAIMGPNGSGKSTLSKVIAGHPDYVVTEGSITYDVNMTQRDLLSMEPDERAREGVFLAFQYPTEIPGVSNLTFLRTAFNAICKHQGVGELGEEEFLKLVRERAKTVELDPSFLDRNVNEGFSGGEKKRNEILQMALLTPRLAVLDETDSGLDIDSLRIVAKGVNQMRRSDNAMLVITHYQRLLDHIVPDRVHVLIDGQIVKSGDSTLALRLEKEGYDWLSRVAH